MSMPSFRRTAWWVAGGAMGVGCLVAVVDIRTNGTTLAGWVPVLLIAAGLLVFAVLTTPEP